MSLRGNLNILWKLEKSKKLFPFQQKKKLKILIKMARKVLALNLTK